MTVRPFVAERPREYAPTPQPIHRRDAPPGLPPGPRSKVPGELLVRFQRDTPSFLLETPGRTMIRLRPLWSGIISCPLRRHRPGA